MRGFDRVLKEIGLKEVPHLPSQVKIIEVSTRDGLQSKDVIVPTEKKIEIVDLLSQSGVHGIEVTSFVRPDVIPQLADARQVMEGIKKNPDIVYSALVPNRKGAEHALECGVDEWGLMVSLSEEHSCANTNCTTEEAIEKARELVSLAKERGIGINGGVLTAFCGEVRKEQLGRLRRLIDTYTDLDVDIINIADTEGLGVPKEVFTIMKELKAAYPEVTFVVHFHDTKHLAMDNAFAALAAGSQYFDCALGGIGGCPAVPHVGGNLPTEAFAKNLQLMGIETGINLNILREARKVLDITLNQEV